MRGEIEGDDTVGTMPAEPGDPNGGGVPTTLTPCNNAVSQATLSVRKISIV